MTCYLCDGPNDTQGSPPVCMACRRANFPGLMAPVEDAPLNFEVGETAFYAGPNPPIGMVSLHHPDCLWCHGIAGARLELDVDHA